MIVLLLPRQINMINMLLQNTAWKLIKESDINDRLIKRVSGYTNATLEGDFLEL